MNQDNTIARASLVIMKLDPEAENGGVPRVFHFSTPENPDPVAAAWELWDSVLHERYPSYRMVVMANPRANILDVQNRNLTALRATDACRRGREVQKALQRAAERNRGALDRLD